MDIRYRAGHIPALDGLRGIAILLVLLFHCGKFEWLPVRSVLALGWVGVDLFFVLSGFLITGILLDTRTRPNYLKNFFARRVLRIFPLYYFVLAVFLGYAFFFAPETYGYYLTHQAYFWTYTQNLLFAFEGWPPEGKLLNHFWSLAIEEQFYLFWPFLVLLFAGKRLVWVSVGMIVLSLLLRNLFPEHPFSYTFTFARTDALAMGALAALLIRTRPEWLNRFCAPLALLSVSVLAWAALSEYSPSVINPHFIRFGYTLFALFFACFLLMLFDVQRTGRTLNWLLRNPLLRIFGKYSYGVYVYHWIIYQLAYYPLAREFSYMGSYFFFPFIALILGVSVLSYYLLERPFLTFKKYFDA